MALDILDKKDTEVYLYMLLLYFEAESFSTTFMILQVFDSISYNRLSKSDALLQHTSSFCAGSGKVPKHAQGSYIWNQW